MNLTAIGAALRALVPPEHRDDIDALVASPEAMAIADRLDAERVADRRGLLGDLAALPAMHQQRQREAAQRVAAIEAERDALRARARQLDEDYAEAYRAQVSVSQWAELTAARIERQIVDSADPRIGGMIAALNEVRNKVRNLERFWVVPGIGRRDNKLGTNHDAIAAAMKVVEDALGSASELRMRALPAREIEAQLREIATRVQRAVGPLGGHSPVLDNSGQITLARGEPDIRSTGQRGAKAAKPLPAALARAKADLQAASK